MNKVYSRLRSIKRIWVCVNERMLNIRTAVGMLQNGMNDEDRSSWKGRRSGNSKYNDDHGYATVNYWYLRKMKMILAPQKQDVLYDLGCGKGRILCYFARLEMKKCIGIELLPELCDIAIENSEKLRKKRTPISITCGDACTMDLDEGTIYFMFNPFGQKTMYLVMMNIELSLKAKPRRINIVYHNAVHLSTLTGCNWLEVYYVYKTSGGLDVAFLRNTQYRSSNAFS